MLSRSLSCPLSPSCLMGHSDVLLRQVLGAETSSSFPPSLTHIWKRQRQASTFRRPRCMSVSLLVKSINKLHGTHNLLLLLATSFSYLGVFQMGEMYQPYHGYYWLFHLPDQMLFPILAPSHSADFVVSSSVMASSLSPMNSTSMSSFF